MSNNTYLTWLNDDRLFTAIKHVHDKYRDALKNQSLKDFTNNVIDPFVFVFDVSLTNKVAQDWIMGESARQLQKKLNNAIGEFHQIILGSCKGWVDLGVGDDSHLDLMKQDTTIYAEVKNKYNTMNSNSKKTVFDNLKLKSEQNASAQVYLVEIIRKTKKPYNKIWNYKKNENERIRRISGDVFYQIVTNEPMALQELYEKLPLAIKDFFTQNKQDCLKIADSLLYQEIKEVIGKTELSRSDFLSYFFKIAYSNYASSNPLQMSLNNDVVEVDLETVDDFEE